jgi:hypothetical protein
LNRLAYVKEMRVGPSYTSFNTITACPRGPPLKERKRTEHFELDPESKLGNGVMGRASRLWALARSRNFKLPYLLEITDSDGQLIYSCKLVEHSAGNLAKSDEHCPSPTIRLNPPLRIVLSDDVENSVADELSATDLAMTIQ